MQTRRGKLRLFAVMVAGSVFATACSSASVGSSTSAPSTSGPTASADATTVPTVMPSDGVLRDADGEEFSAAPSVPEDFDPALSDALDIVFGSGLPLQTFAYGDREQMEILAASGDPRVAWPLGDILRFVGPGDESANVLYSTTSAVTGLELDGPGAWNELVNHLIAWDIPAPPGYVGYKRALYSLVEKEWEPFFDDAATEVDYRYWSWGGVGIDDRPYDHTDESCFCIPAADNPLVTDAAGGDWYDDDRIVFGLVIDGEARAYPRNIMEIREMVNDSLGGRDFAMPYCTLCGSAQVFFTDQVPDGVERPVMRTSGLLTRSNKIMYDITSGSVFDTFKGNAVTGDLAAQGVTLEQAPVVTTTWGEWKAQYPDTTILDESLAMGRESDLLNTRDADGPIFPVGDVDTRLPVQEPILGVVSEAGDALAFPVEAARTALLTGERVGLGEVTVEQAAGGIRALDGAGNELPSHQAFWFAWSQFYPDTELWSP